MSKHENGFVSIIVAALIMIILSLITLGFSRLMQREQRQALDRQLSRQALYAAESGINDIFKELKEDAASGSPVLIEKSSCDVTASPAVEFVTYDNDPVEYTCTLYDQTPSVLSYDINPQDSRLVTLQTESGTSFSTITISWGNNQDGGNDLTTLPDCSSPAAFDASRATSPPLIRFDLSNMAGLGRDSLISNTDNLYLSSCRNSGASSSYVFDKTTKGNIRAVECVGATDMPCSVTIDVSAENSSMFFARLRPVYSGAKLQISAIDVNGDTIEFAQEQTSIDVTAKASDIVRRLRVAIPLSNPEDGPEATVQVFDGICKLLEVNTASNTVNDNCY